MTKKIKKPKKPSVTDQLKTAKDNLKLAEENFYNLREKANGWKAKAEKSEEENRGLRLDLMATNESLAKTRGELNGYTLGVTQMSGKTMPTPDQLPYSNVSSSNQIIGRVSRGDGSYNRPRGF